MDIQIVEHKENNMQIIIKCRQIDNVGKLIMKLYD